MKTKTRIFIAFIAVFVALLALGVFFLSHGPSPAIETPDPILIGAPGLEQNALIYVALDRGLFEKNGLNVTLRDDYPTGVGPVQDMATGKLDLSVSAEYPVIVRIFAGGNVSIINSIDKYQNEELITRKDTGIRNITDLRGKKIGVPRGTILEFFLGRLLERSGLKLADVTLIDVNTTHAVDAIAGGEVDAIMYFQPHVYRIRDRLGDNAITWRGQGGQLLYAVITARNVWIEGHPGEVRRFLMALDEAQDYADRHPEETRAMVKKRLNLTNPYLDEVWPEHQFGVSLDQSLLVAMNDEGRWAIANNMTPVRVVPDFHSALSTPALLAVNPVAVNIR